MLIPDSVVASNEKTLRDKLRLKLETGQKAGLKVRDIKLVSHGGCLIALLLFDDGRD